MYLVKGFLKKGNEFDFAPLLTIYLFSLKKRVFAECFCKTLEDAKETKKTLKKQALLYGQNRVIIKKI